METPNAEASEPLPAKTFDPDVDVDDEAIQDQPTEQDEQAPRAEGVDGEEATVRRQIEPVPSDFAARVGTEDSDLIQTVAMAAQPQPQKAGSRAPTPQDTPGGRSDPIVQQGQFGKYQIINRIGAGGFGKVYLGRDPVLGRDVAVKTCTSEDEPLRRRFLREAKIAAGLQHPNIVTVYDFGYEGEIPYMVQEYLDGEDLAEKIGRGDLSLEVKIDYLLRIAKGLAHAHEHDVLHRDIKPANIRILADGQVRILDFGIARLLNETTAFTTDGITLGTVGYLAPEILNSDDVDSRSDIFSFGVLAYELLSHQRPFTGDSFVRVSFRLLNEEPTPLKELVPDCPPPLIRMVNICLEKSPGDRYASFDEIVAILTRLIEDSQARPAAAYSAYDRHDSGPRPQSASIDGSPANPSTASSSPSTTPVGGLKQSPRRPWHLPALLASLSVIAILVILVIAGRQDQDGIEAGSTVAETSPSASIQTSQATPRDPAPPNAAGPTEGHEDPSTKGSSRQTPGPDRASSAPEKAVAPSAFAPSSPAQPVGESEPAQAPGSAINPQQNGSAPAPQATEGSGLGDPEQTDSTKPSVAPADSGSSAAVVESGGKSVPTTQDETDPPAESVQSTDPKPDDRSTPPPESTEPESRAVSSSPPAAPSSQPSTSDSAAAAPSSGTTPPETSKSSVRVFPQLIEQVQPIYPPRARRKRVEAAVTVGVRVDADGKVVRTLIKSSTTQGMGFEEAAKKAAELSRFRPGTIGGEPTAMWAEMVFQFRLPG